MNSIAIFSNYLMVITYFNKMKSKINESDLDSISKQHVLDQLAATKSDMLSKLDSDSMLDDLTEIAVEIISKMSKLREKGSMKYEHSI